MSKSYVSELIIPWPGLIFFACLVSLVIAVQIAIGYLIASSKTVVSNISCSVQSVDIGGQPLLWGFDKTSPSITIACGGKEYKIKEQSVIISYLYTKKPLTCSIDGAGGATCALQE